METLGGTAADQIDWRAPRPVSIAAAFAKYDGHAVQQINRNIQLTRFRLPAAQGRAPNVCQ